MLVYGLELLEHSITSSPLYFLKGKRKKKKSAHLLHRVRKQVIISAREASVRDRAVNYRLKTCTSASWNEMETPHHTFISPFFFLLSLHQKYHNGKCLFQGQCIIHKKKNTKGQYVCLLRNPISLHLNPQTSPFEMPENAYYSGDKHNSLVTALVRGT